MTFWAAGRLAIAGHPELAYNIPVHHAAEQAAGPVMGLLPFAYPPPFLAAVAPFALLPFGPAFFAWLGATLAVYAWAVRRIVPLHYAFAIPAGYINLLIGQTGFLMAGIFIAGTLLIETSPWLAGAILGLMLFKPQLALLLPVAMLAGRQWRVIGGAIMAVCVLLLIGLSLDGWDSYQAFLATLPLFVGFVRDGRLQLSELASLYALGRSFGLSEGSALLVHSVVALVAAAVTARAWWGHSDNRVPILGAASLLISPYIWTYDAVLLVVPVGWMIVRGRHPYAVAAAWLCALVPIVNYYSPIQGPNLTSVAALICLWALRAEPLTQPLRTQGVELPENAMQPAS